MRMPSMLALVLSVSLLVFLFGCPATTVEKGDAIAVWQQKGSTTATAVGGAAEPGSAGSTYDVWYSLWDHAGKKWFVPSGGVTAPIATDSGDDHDADVSSNKKTAIAVWSKVTGGSSKIYYSRWESDAWARALPIESGSADTDPTVAMEPSGKAVAVWVSGGKTLVYSKFTPGVGWAAPDKITSMDRVSLPELAYGGKHYLVFTASSGSVSSAYESVFDGSSWSAPVPVSPSAILDNNIPTGQRTGITAGNKGEATSVFPGTDGKVYSHAFGAAAANAFAGGSMPDDATDASGKANGAYSSATDLYHQPSVNAPAAPAAISTLAGDDSRASLAFIRERKVGLVVFWKPEGIYYSYMEAGAWAEAKPLGSSPGRNPAVTPITGGAVEGPYCGNNILEPPEQCEVAIACANPNDICMPDCTCFREPPPKNKTKCGDGKLQGAEQCEVGIACANAAATCRIPPCECTIKSEPKNETPPNKTTISCAANTLTVNYAKDGSVNVQASPTLACKDDCKELNPNWECDPQGCFCKESRVVTPRCGDGYVSTPNTPGGGNEECDVGFGFYQPKDEKGNPVTKPDTCPAPKKCDAASCKCVLPVTENITQYHSECDFEHGVCTQVQGEGQNECSSDSQCVKPPVCGNQEVETGEVCESNSDCVRQISGQTVGGTCKDSCKTCEYNLYCGDGIVFAEGGEQCENDNQCSQGNVCSGCLCVPKPTHKACVQGACAIVDGAGSNQCSVSSDCVPPVINCDSYCSGAGYPQNLGGGYSNSQACYTAATSGQPATCTTLCQFAKYYTESNQAGTSSCCCGKQVSLACTDCPGQNPVCPAQSACEAYNPG